MKNQYSTRETEREHRALLRRTAHTLLTHRAASASTEANHNQRRRVARVQVIRSIFQFSDHVLSMTDNDRDEDRASKTDRFLPRENSLRSFVNHYGTDEPYLTRTEWIRHQLKARCASLSFWRCLNACLESIPLLRCLKDYNVRKNLYGDIMAGIIVAIMHIPQGEQGCEDCRSQASLAF